MAPRPVFALRCLNPGGPFPGGAMNERAPAVCTQRSSIPMPHRQPRLVGPCQGKRCVLTPANGLARCWPGPCLGPEDDWPSSPMMTEALPHRPAVGSGLTACAGYREMSNVPGQEVPDTGHTPCHARIVTPGAAIVFRGCSRLFPAHYVVAAFTASDRRFATTEATMALPRIAAITARLTSGLNL